MSLRKVIAMFILRITGTVWARCRGFRIESFACGYGLDCSLRTGVAYKLVLGFRVITGFAYKLQLNVKVRAFEVRSYHWVSTSGQLAHTATTGFQLKAGFAHSYYCVSTLEQVSHTATTVFQR